MGLLRRPTPGGIVKGGQWAGPTGRARSRDGETNLRLRRHFRISRSSMLPAGPLDMAHAANYPAGGPLATAIIWLWHLCRHAW
jgi:hypothetical protein